MRTRTATLAAVALAAVAVALALVFGGKQSPDPAKAEEKTPGEPTVEIISPRNGARQENHAVVAKVAVENFQLAPGQLGSEPQLGEGHLRFSYANSRENLLLALERVGESLAKLERTGELVGAGS